MKTSKALRLLARATRKAANKGIPFPNIKERTPKQAVEILLAFLNEHGLLPRKPSASAVEIWEIALEYGIVRGK